MDNNEPGIADPDPTEVIALPADLLADPDPTEVIALPADIASPGNSAEIDEVPSASLAPEDPQTDTIDGGEHEGDDEDSATDTSDPESTVASQDAVDDGKPGWLTLEHWRQFSRQFIGRDLRWYLPRAAATAALLTVVIGVAIAAAQSKGDESVTDASDSTELSETENADYWNTQYSSIPTSDLFGVTTTTGTPSDIPVPTDPSLPDIAGSGQPIAEETYSSDPPPESVNPTSETTPVETSPNQTVTVTETPTTTAGPSGSATASFSFQIPPLSGGDSTHETWPTYTQDPVTTTKTVTVTVTPEATTTAPTTTTRTRTPKTTTPKSTVPSTTTPRCATPTSRTKPSTSTMKPSVTTTTPTTSSPRPTTTKPQPSTTRPCA